jgi:opacity protein-like surface antigen
MKSIRTLLTGALLATGLATTAQAADPLTERFNAPDSFYISVQGGVGPFIGEHDFFAPNSNAPGPLAGDADYDTVWSIGASAGVFLTENFRIGADLNYFSTEADTMDVVTPFLLEVQLDGSINGVSAFVDAGYEMMVTEQIGIFGEVGIGVLHINADNIQTDPNFNGFIDASDTVLAGKVGGGAFYQFNERVELFGEYNYIFAEDADLSFTAPGSGLPVVPFEIETDAHAFLVGLRFRM